jgi:D-3-phosphoglycerate dehydrogenase
MGAINRMQAEVHANIVAQYLRTTQEIGYVVMDVNQEASPDLLERLGQLEGTIRARILY